MISILRMNMKKRKTVYISSSLSDRLSLFEKLLKRRNINDTMSDIFSTALEIYIAIYSQIPQDQKCDICLENVFGKDINFNFDLKPFNIVCNDCDCN